jgi:hypothetical protein
MTPAWCCSIMSTLVPTSRAIVVGCAHHDPRELAGEDRDLVPGARRPLAELAQREL